MLKKSVFLIVLVFIVSLSLVSAVTIECPDINGDGRIDIFDLGGAALKFGQVGSGLVEDINNDGIVNIFDLSFLVAKFGTTCSMQEPPPPTEEPVLVESENLNLDSGYVEESNGIYDDGVGIRIADGNGAGTATTTFTGATGTYDIVISIVEEDDGQSTVTLTIGGNEIGTFTYGLSPSGFQLADVTYSNVQISNGDEIKIDGDVVGSAYARINNIEFIPVQTEFCGDGNLNAGEECDDGNTVSGDGCSATCVIENEFCGDGIMDAGEECDDNNNFNNDGCSAACVVEVAECGNNIVEGWAGEECDTTPAQQCGYGYQQCQVCTVDCKLTPGDPGPYCGDGNLDAGQETCDDGNNVDGDGCSATCVDENIPIPTGFVASVRDGMWSNPNTWSTGSVPGQGDNVLIRPSDDVVYDVHSSEEIRLIHIRGKLKFTRDKDTQLDVGALIASPADNVNPDPMCGIGYVSAFDSGTAALEIGTWDNPIPNNIKATIRLTDFNDLGNNCNPVIIAHGDGSRVDIHGSPIVNTWSELDAPANRGSNTVTVRKDISDWEIGDEIVITGTRGPDSSHTTSLFSGNSESEVRTITAINGRTITFNGDLDYEHICRNKGLRNEMCGEVGLLTRNVVVTSKNPGGVRGHTMYHHGGKGSLSYVEFDKLGKGGVLARYPVHFHITRSSKRNDKIKGASIHDSNNRCITIHATDYILAEDNVCYNTLGHAIFMEDGSEVNNYVNNNLVVRTRTTGQLPGQALPYDDNRAAGVWSANQKNAFTYNTVANADEWFYEFEFSGGDEDRRDPRDLVVPTLQDDGSIALTAVNKLPFIKFKGNEGHGSNFWGFGSAAQNDPKDPSVVEDLTMWRVWYSSGFNVRNFLIKGLTMMDASYGMYGRSPAGYKLVDGYFEDISVESIMWYFRPEGLHTIEDVVIKDSKAFRITGTRTEDHYEDLIVHVKDYELIDLVDNRGGHVAASEHSNSRTNIKKKLILHDYFGTDQDAIIIPATHTPDDGRDYSITGPEFKNVKVAVGNEPWQESPIELIDTRPPATAIKWPADGSNVDEGDLRVTGTVIDASEVTSIMVNGRQASLLEPGEGMGDWEVILPNVQQGVLPITAKSIDKFGNMEENLHTIRINVGDVSAVPSCGNGNLNSGEQCDDGNTNNGDGCSSICQAEDGYFFITVSEKTNHPLLGIGSAFGYVINGVQGMELTLTRGVTYTFVVNVPASHPFYVSTSSEGQSLGQYSDGVSSQPMINGVMTFTPQANAPDLLYYQCMNHLNMGYKVNIIGN